MGVTEFTATGIARESKFAGHMLCSPRSPKSDIAPFHSDLIDGSACAVIAVRIFAG